MKIQPIEVDEVAFAQAVEKIKVGELDRAAAAAHAGMKLSTFQTYLKRRNLLDELKHTRKNAQPRPELQLEPERAAQYAAAIEDVLAGRTSIRGACQPRGKYFGLNEQVLGRKVRAERSRRELVVSG